MDLKTEVWAGFGAGAATAFGITVAEAEGKFGIEANAKIEFKEKAVSANEESYKVGYVLTDGNDGDQFSVTAIKGTTLGFTPYFDLLGGRSSCPYEEGTISRDMPTLELMDQEGNIFNNTFYDLDPVGDVQIPIKISSGNLFGEDRMILLTQPLNANSRDAKLFAQGKRVSQDKGVVYFVPADSSVYARVTVNRNTNYFDYSDIYLVVKPSCENKVHFEESFIFDTVRLELHYRRPCSPITMHYPEGGWMINNEGYLGEQKLQIKLADFHLDLDDFPENDHFELDNIIFQYRKAGQLDWKDFETISADSLDAWYHEYKTSYPAPTYIYDWDVKADPKLVDGNYEIRTKVDCGTNFFYGPAAAGIIDRSSPAVVSYPQPADGVLNYMDEISVAFNKPLACDFFVDSAFAITRRDGSVVPATMSCNGSAYLITLVNGPEAYNGDTLTVKLWAVRDLSGNISDDTITWAFEVRHRVVEWTAPLLEVDATKGAKVPVSAAWLTTMCLADG
ncbi:MAG: Ig-like domain-containing protein [Cytophagales bacterium]|nr:Ig-like domain-containing protein [Cytophagales bacterium]